MTFITIAVLIFILLLLVHHGTCINALRGRILLLEHEVRKLSNPK